MAGRRKSCSAKSRTSSAGLRPVHETRDPTDKQPADGEVRSDADHLRSRVDQAAEALSLHEIDGPILDADRRMGQRSGATLGASGARFRRHAERDHLLAWEVDARTWGFSYVSSQAADILGYPVDDWYRPEFWVEHIHPDDRQWTLDYCRHRSATDADYEFEYRMLAADGRSVWFQNVVHVIRDRSGPRTLRGFMIDITARKRAEAARQLLLRELDHRVKNTLATVQAVAELTLRTSTSLEEFGDTFRGRIAALARMHAAIWRSKGAPLELRELVELSLAPFRHGGERVSIDGAEVPIPLGAVAALGLVLHELATNAAKHGALSVPSGGVRVTWRSEGDRLCLMWRESGGPIVTPPAHRGFGSTLIEESIPYELGGSVAVDFPPAGIECTITVPLVAAQRPAAPHPRSESST